MPALLELQRSLRAQLFGDAADGDATGGEALMAGDDGALRLAIYRHTAFGTLVNALRLSFPAVQRLVGADFFEAAARDFIRRNPPASAYLNDYGAGFPAFLAAYAPAAALAYLGEVAQLEWAVNRALHASDVPRLDLARLAALDEAALSQVSFSAHPALSLLRLEFPADAIWRAVLEQNDAAMAAIDLAAGPVHLLVERSAAGVQVRCLSASAWEFTARLCAGGPLSAVLADGSDGDGDVDAWLAEHLALGRLVDFSCTTAAAATVAAGETRS
jgi:hypothetical protein